MVKTKIKHYRKSYTSLWLDNEELLDLNRVGLWRVIWGKPDRIILQLDLPMSDVVKKLVYFGAFNLGMFTRETGRLDTLDNAIHIMTFENCQLHRKWIPQPVPLYADAEVITAFVEFTCKIVEHNV